MVLDLLLVVKALSDLYKFRRRLLYDGPRDSDIINVREEFKDQKKLTSQNWIWHVHHGFSKR